MKLPMRAGKQWKSGNAIAQAVTLALVFCAALVLPAGSPAAQASSHRNATSTPGSDVGAPPARTPAALQQRIDCESGRPAFASAADLSGVNGATFNRAEMLAAIAGERWPLQSEYARGRRGRAPPYTTN